MEELFKHWTLGLSIAVEAAAALIIGFGAMEAAIRCAGIMWKRHLPDTAKDDARLRFGRWLALALEFLLAADILRTAVAPTWNEIGQLAAIVVLRTALNYFLQKEIESGGSPRHRAVPTAAGLNQHAR